MTARGRWLTWGGLLLVLLSIWGIAWGDRVLSELVLYTFTDFEGTQWEGTYYPGSQPAGVLILEGFGSDQVTMRSLSRSFAQMGMHVFTFDFSGHGVSPGALGFDNAATDRLARQAIAAQALFAAEAGLAGEQIVVVGHSMGARVALQAAVLDWTLFQLGLGSLSGVVGGLQGVVILLLVLLHGRLLQRLGGSPLLVALLQAIVLYWLILPQGVLFTR